MRLLYNDGGMTNEEYVENVAYEQNACIGIFNFVSSKKILKPLKCVLSFRICHCAFIIVLKKYEVGKYVPQPQP